MYIPRYREKLQKIGNLEVEKWYKQEEIVALWQDICSGAVIFIYVEDYGHLKYLDKQKSDMWKESLNILILQISDIVMNRNKDIWNRIECIHSVNKRVKRRLKEGPPYSECECGCLTGFMSDKMRVRASEGKPRQPGHEQRSSWMVGVQLSSVECYQYLK